jgi:hypothetical protein
MQQAHAQERSSRAAVSNGSSWGQLEEPGVVDELVGPAAA